MAKTKHNIKVHSSFHSIYNMVNGIYEIIFGVQIFCGFMQRLFVSGSDSGVSGHVRKCFDTYKEMYLYLLGNIFVLLRKYFCSEAFWGFGLRLFVSESTSGVSGFVKKCFCIYKEIYLYLQGNVSVFIGNIFGLLSKGILRLWAKIVCLRICLWCFRLCEEMFLYLWGYISVLWGNIPVFVRKYFVLVRKYFCSVSWDCLSPDLPLEFQALWMWENIFCTYEEIYLYLWGFVLYLWKHMLVLVRKYFHSWAFWGFEPRLFVSGSASGVSGLVRKCPQGTTPRI